jgi:hypothetical protein
VAVRSPEEMTKVMEYCGKAPVTLQEACKS